MGTFDRKIYWENIYQKKQIDEVSWYQPRPATSLDFVKEFNLPLNAKIIDVGGGDSFFVDHLLELGYEDITVLDISAKAIDRAKERLGDKASRVKWIVADASDFQPTEQYDFWHDRAAFHFLTEENDIESYLRTVSQHLSPSGHLVIGTFSTSGPEKCSGISIRQYSEKSMGDRLKGLFEKVKCIRVDHETPFDTVQNFIFCSFKPLASAA